MKISVVIPIYNVEKYLLSCVNSVMTQTYPNCEVIFVNDGSPDSSMDVLEKYLSTEKVRFPYTVINHEKTEGYPLLEIQVFVPLLETIYIFWIVTICFLLMD